MTNTLSPRISRIGGGADDEADLDNAYRVPSASDNLTIGNRESCNLEIGDDGIFSCGKPMLF